MQQRILAAILWAPKQTTARPAPLVNRRTVRASTTMATKDEFGAEADRYHTSRPSYPQELVEHFTSSLPKTSRKWALDVAAGSGQLSVLLAENFDRVVALDKSEEQIKHGHSRPNISYCAGVATKLPNVSEKEATAKQKFDAVTCAQAYHWFVEEKSDKDFLEEAQRIMDPDHGRLGIFGYGVCSISSSPTLETIFKDFYYKDLGSNLPPSSPDCHWNIDRRLVDNGLAGISTYNLMEVVETRQHIETRKMTIHMFLDYLRTLSALPNLRKVCAAKGEIDPMERLHKAFEANSVDDQVLDVDFPFFLIILKPT